MFSGIAGYTAIMGADEEKGIRLRGEHRALLGSFIPRFDGHVLEEVGDGTLASFNSAVDAVYAAREIQRSLQKRSDLRLRIGIHEGDVVFADGNVMGDAVNVASRIHADSLLQGPTTLRLLTATDLERSQKHLEKVRRQKNR